MDEKDEDLPLHAEAMAREKWRGGETLITKGGEDLSLPASEVDNAAEGGVSGGGATPDPTRLPPD